MAAGNAPADGSPHDGAVGVGGFILFPSAAFTRDSKSMTTYLSGNWWPIPRSWMAPDGQSYAYALNSSDPVVHVVSTFSGADTAITLGSLVATAARTNVGAKQVLAFEPEGIYLQTVTLNSDRLPFGLTLLDPRTAAYLDSPYSASSSETYTAVHNGLAYTGWGANGADSITVGGPSPHWNELIVRPIAKQTPTPEAGSAYVPDSWLRIVGFDGGQQPIMSAESTASYRIYTGALFGSLPAPVFVGRTGDPDNPIGPAVADGTGIWFGSESGVLWYYPGGGAPFERVAVAPFHPARPAGPCSK